VADRFRLKYGSIAPQRINLVKTSPACRSIRQSSRLCLILIRSFGLGVLSWLVAFPTAVLGDSSNPTPVPVSPQLAPTPPPKPLPINRPLVQTPSLGGTQITLNGRTGPGVWSQWPGSDGKPRIGLSDATLMQTVGLQLLSTASLSFQPVTWFTDDQAPITLNTRLISPVRYLDIADLVTRFGWQVQVSGTALQITTPAAKVLGIRQGNQPWGDRVVIDLDRPTPWQADPQGQELILTLDAAADPALIANFKAMVGKKIQSIKVTTAGNRTTLRLGLPITTRSRIWTVANPNRLIIDVRPDYLVEQDILWAPGIRWRQQMVPLGPRQFPVVWFEINPRQPKLTLRPVLPNPNGVPGTAPLIQTAQQAQAVIAINGGYFNRNNLLPLGAVRINSQWFSGPILNRGAVGWNDTGEMIFDRLTLQETAVTPNGRFPLTHLNSGYVQAGIARYTPAWGSSYTTLADNEILLTVQNNQVIEQRIAATAGTILAIPANSYLLVFRSNRTAASAFPVGITVQLESVTNPPNFDRYPYIIGGGPLLLQNRQVVVEGSAEQFSPAFVQQAAVRSAIGQTSDGKIIIAAVHNRVNAAVGGEDGAGPTLNELAQLMGQLGAVNALNFDGGSSTTLYLGGQIVDRPPRSPARVHNLVGVFIQK
jgi:Phosphodiester glycosidase